jgi:3'-phosphoadenosine 5'-phosphosulfate sulfotransferase (PAPS reductase)/FAD synthetase
MERLQRLADEGAVFYVNMSGGKDSLLTYLTIAGVVPRDQISILHADLEDVDWPDLPSHIAETTGQTPNVVRAKRSFLELVEHRRKWPSPQQRFCTSDLKRQPLEAFIRRDMNDRGARLAVDCQGIRSAESNRRARMVDFKTNDRLSNSKRTVFTSLPIFDRSTPEVFDLIAQAGRQVHYAYGLGSRRVSCPFCIMACRSDLQVAAREHPKLLDRLAETEARIGHTIFFKNGRPIPIKDHIHGGQLNATKSEA